MEFRGSIRQTHRDGATAGGLPAAGDCSSTGPASCRAVRRCDSIDPNLIEVLIAAVTTSLLLALVVPAVLSAQVTAHQRQCRNPAAPPPGGTAELTTQSRLTSGLCTGESAPRIPPRGLPVERPHEILFPAQRLSLPASVLPVPAHNVRVLAERAWSASPSGYAAPAASVPVPPATLDTATTSAPEAIGTSHSGPATARDAGQGGMPERVPRMNDLNGLLMIGERDLYDPCFGIHRCR